MNEKNFPPKLCELLAQQLVEEQAELVKREAVVEQIKCSLREKKMEVIKRRLVGRVIRYNHRKFIVTEIERDDYDNGLFVMVRLGEIPNAYLERTDLTKREKELLLDYKEALKSCRWNLTPQRSERVRDAVEQIRPLKHGINLEEFFNGCFNFEEFSQPGFFNHSGITVTTDTLRGCAFLEDC